MPLATVQVWPVGQLVLFAVHCVPVELQVSGVLFEHCWLFAVQITGSTGAALQVS
jgi:hypothetical protein